jgi:hypothetical protein
MRSKSVVVAGLFGAGLVAACGGATEPRESVSYVPAASPAMTNPVSATSPHAAPLDPAAAGAPAPAAPIQSSAPANAPAAAPAPAPSPPQPMAAAPASAGSPAAATPPANTGASASPAAPINGFDAGSGMMQADGKTVVYHIPDGTGGKDWNPKDKPIRVERGMTLRLIDDDKSTRSGGHWLHTNGQPCPHGLKAIGTGFDCAIGRNAPYGVVSGTFEHNVANGIGRVYIEVVETKAATD